MGVDHEDQILHSYCYWLIYGNEFHWGQKYNLHFQPSLQAAPPLKAPNWFTGAKMLE